MLFDEDIIDYHNLFQTAQQEICVFTGNNDMEYADEFIKAARRFTATPGTMLRIACQCGKDINRCTIIQTILSSPERQGDVMVYDASHFRGEPYFLLADKAAYRIEIPALAETIVDFGDKEETMRLFDQFQHIIDRSPLKIHTQSPQPSFGTVMH